MSPRGNSIDAGSPSRAARSIQGPPGNGSPSRRATLSKASPAASSMVAAQRPDVGGDVGDEQQRGVAAGDEQRHGRLGQRAVLEHVDGDVRREVVDAVQPDAERRRRAPSRRRRRR